jgi:hypothetical protein
MVLSWSVSVDPSTFQCSFHTALIGLHRKEVPGYLVNFDHVIEHTIIRLGFTRASVTTTWICQQLSSTRSPMIYIVNPFTVKLTARVELSIVMVKVAQRYARKGKPADIVTYAFMGKG